MTEELQMKFYRSQEAFAIQAPCYEASFAADHRSALKLYDCLVPKVKELSLRCDRCKALRESKGI